MQALEDFSKKYFDFLTTELSGINLTAIKDYEAFHAKQILDSVAPFKQSLLFKNLIKEKKIVVDIGFGGGFPILPLAFLMPEVTFLGIESKRKKVEAVSKIAEHLGLKNVKLMHSRFEEILFDKETVIVSKAVATIENILLKLEYSVNTHVFFYKGPNLIALEEKGLNNTKESWEQIVHTSIEVPQTENRILIGFKNKSVPRGTSKPTGSKKTIKFSDIV